MRCWRKPIFLGLFLGFSGLALVRGQNDGSVAKSPVDAAAARHATSAPEAEIDNGVLKVRFYLPDARKGFYRGTRFDWSGVIGSLEYKGHRYYGPWFTKTDP